jgi:translation initiation factor IF-1
MYLQNKIDYNLSTMLNAKNQSIAKMVKNTTGGSGHKSQARKLVSSGKSNRLRLSENALEQYAYVSKMLGNGMCYVITDSGASLMCHIRGKFRSRNKKNNMVAPSSIILVGIRDWESEQKNCDLLEIYDAEDVRQMRSNPAVDLSGLDRHVSSNMSSSQVKQSEVEELVFTNDVEIEYSEQMDASSNQLYRIGEEIVAFEDI